MKIHFGIVCFSLILLSGCAMTRAMAVPDGSSANGRLKSDIVGMIHIYQKANDPGCSYKVAEVNQLPNDGKLVLEEWVVEACDKKVSYEVKLTPSTKGGAFYAVKRLDL